MVEETEEHWSDAPETLDGEHSPDLIQVQPIQDTNIDQDLSLKVSTDTPKSGISPPILESSVGTMSPVSEEREPASPAASIHSLPIVHVTAPTSPVVRPSTARSPNEVHRSMASIDPPPSPSRGHMSVDGAPSNLDRRNRQRATIDARSSRFSGFFSSLIHRRDNVSSPRSATREDRPSTPLTGSLPDSQSRSASPAPTRPSTPPPQLPAPSLHDLGLSLSVLTSDLSPSHFSTPPSSGAFLAPNYLLLCHPQGLDVLPLISPPAPQPYALVRRVSFKSVVVMEQRGVLVAIAGRRDGVRVYALEEVKKVVEWRMEVEIRRERERSRRDEAKKASSSFDHSILGTRESTDRKAKSRLPTPPEPIKGKSPRRSNTTSSPLAPKKIRPPIQTVPIPPLPPVPLDEQPIGRPPPYTNNSTRLPSPPSLVSLPTRNRASSVGDVLSGAASIRRNTELDLHRPPLEESKTDDWVEARGSSDDEAIDIVAAGPSGSQALDERTSSRAAPSISPVVRTESPVVSRPRAQSTRRNRPANLDLSLTQPNNSNVVPPEHSPTPTLHTLRQTLTRTQSTMPPDEDQRPDTARDDDDDESTEEQLTLAQALLESRIPELPPAGSRRPQQPILISPVEGADDDLPASPRSSCAPSTFGRNSVDPGRRRRRWSVNLFSNSPNTTPTQPTLPNPMSIAESHSTGAIAPRRERTLVRSQSSRSRHSLMSASLPARPSTSGSGRPSAVESSSLPPVPAIPQTPMSAPSGPSHTHTRFFSRIISNAFSSRRSEDQPQTLVLRNNDHDGLKGTGPHSAVQAPPPKLEYVKLPGTKGALMVKSVETAKKSFLAILCGENGEKVELFAGTYRTALGLSRTFILPDSPRSLELQLQGDDLVEVFLVFSQNVFGLEPATVRVREVRIGRAERRAARRRARELRADTDPTTNPDEETNVNVSIGVSVSATNADALSPGQGPHPAERQNPPTSASAIATPTSAASPDAITDAAAEELLALATAQMGPYTTFQQLSFAPNFPLASIADEYIIPPTYPSFLEYRTEHEPEASGSSSVDLAQVQFSPPGLPVPAPSPPSRWFYRDPKGVVHGPWKASLMQSWYKDGLLPPDLPLRKEEETEYVLLKDLRLQSVDPTHPFRSPPPPIHTESLSMLEEHAKPLLSPISLLSQPKHFGPPALFFSSRGGHSTTIVDSRGRSVLKGRFMWSADDQDEDSRSPVGRMGDIKRLEAFDVKDRAVLVAMRQGGLEAVDLGDALLRPADESRSILPHFTPTSSSINRRSPFVWRIGTPVSSSSSNSSLNVKSRSTSHSHRKPSGTAGKSPGRAEFLMSGDPEYATHDEVLFLGRKDDEVYLCERIAGSFRLLRLSPYP